MHCCVVNVVYKNENKITVTFASNIYKIKEAQRIQNGDCTIMRYSKVRLPFSLHNLKELYNLRIHQLDLLLFSLLISFKWTLLTMGYYTSSPFLPSFSVFSVIFFKAAHTHTPVENQLLNTNAPSSRTPSPAPH